MSGGEKEDMGFLHVNEGILNHATSEINTNQMSEKISGTAVNNYFASSWDPIASLSQSDNFGVSTMVSHGDFSNSLYPTEMENQGMSSSSCIQYPAASSYANLTPKGHCYGSGNCSEMVGSYGIPEHGKITATGYSSNHIPNIQNSGDRAPGNDSNPQNVFGTREERVAGASPDGKKRKRAPDLDSPRKSKKNAEEGLQKNVSEESSDGAKQATSIPKSGQNSDKNVNNKQTGKQAAESSHSEEASKDSYIHVRARRGQATNSHSLAERLRREKISERMRLLQDLVPGCNKITGKAVMLDEIINYVQSLQQQVEFLSMKLATVNPELNFDIDRILSKDVSQGCSPAVLGLGPGMSAASHPYQLGNLHGNFQAIPHIPQFTPLPHAVLDNDFQSLLQMGFNASSSMENLGPNGRFKPEM